MKTPSNARESDQLLPDECSAFEAARHAVDVLKKTFETWCDIGRAVVVATEAAARIGGRQTFKHLMHQQGLAHYSDKGTASRLRKIMDPENRVAIEQWRAGLTERQRIEYAAPTTVMKRCPHFARHDIGKQVAAKEKAATKAEQYEEAQRKIAHLEEQLAAADEGSLFDLKRDKAIDIAGIIVDRCSPNKAAEIAKHIRDLVKAKEKQPVPAG